MPCSTIRNLASASGAGETFRRAGPSNPTQSALRFERMIGGGDLWVTEFTLSYDGAPSYVVSIMEFRDSLVAHETQYFCDRFDPSPGAQLAPLGDI